MQSSQGDFFEIVVPGQTSRMEMATLSITDVGKKSSFSMGSTYLLGDAIHPPKHDAVYLLPYPKGESYLMSQGYNGSFSHQNKNALDFTMDIGTPICAAREGVVTEVIDRFSKGCNDPSCLYEANTITVYHEDGTFADYAHLKKNGSLVKPGDKIRSGQVIGYSGNTGYSSGPHLHFEVYYFDHDQKISLTTPFDIGNNKPVYLEEKNMYTAQ
jgi:murein DD-endopeptidase MepM/ murein hydrolase activator NlpD